MFSWVTNYFKPANQFNYHLQIGVGKYYPAPLSTRIGTVQDSLADLNEEICKLIYTNYINVQERLIQSHKDHNNYLTDIFLHLTLNGYWNAEPINITITSFLEYKKFMENQNIILPPYINKIIQSGKEENGTLNFDKNNCYWHPKTCLTIHVRYFKMIFIDIPQKESFESVQMSIERCIEIEKSIYPDHAINNFLIEVKGTLEDISINKQFDHMNELIEFLENHHLIYSFENKRSPERLVI